MSKLTAKQQRFVAEYLVDLNATQAAMRAGYAESTANKKAPLWVGKSRDLSPYPEIWDAVKLAIDKRSKRVEITQDDVLRDLMELRDMCMGRRPIQKDVVVDGKPVSVEVKDFNQAGAAKALELLGKHLKMFTDRVEHSQSVADMSDEALETAIIDLIEQQYGTRIDINKLADRV